MRPRLVVGLALLAALAVIASLPSLLAPFPRGYSDSLRTVDGPDGTEWLFAPEAPSSYYPLGTDRYGYDIATTLAWGLRWTLGTAILVAALRVAAGTTLGLARALATGRGRKPSATSPLSVIPSFVFVFFLLYPATINSPLGSVPLFLFQCAAMTVFDLGGISSTVSLKAARILKAEFTQSAVSCGAGKAWLARYHILPFLAPFLAEAFADQAVAALQMVGRLGVFSLFIGGTVMRTDPPILTSVTGEIAGLVGLNRASMMGGAYWTVLAPLAAYLATLVVFRTLAGGLRETFEAKGRMYEGAGI